MVGAPAALALRPATSLASGPGEGANKLRAVARPLVNVVERWMPNPLVFAGLSARDILGRTTITLFVSGAVMLAKLLLAGAL